MMKNILIRLLAAAVCFGILAGCAAHTPVPVPSGGETDSVTLPDKFIVGLDASFPPMGFMDENGEIVGVDIDLAKAVCEKLGIEFVAKPISWDEKELAVNTGEVTCIWNGLTVTTERNYAFELSRPYMRNQQVIVVMEDSPIQEKADLAGKTVAAQSDSSGLFSLQKDPIITEIAQGEALEFDDYIYALEQLRAGLCDAVVMDSVVADYYLTKMDIRILEEAMATEEYAIAFKKGEKGLCRAVEEALSELESEGVTAQISRKWFARGDMFITNEKQDSDGL